MDTRGIIVVLLILLVVGWLVWRVGVAPSMLEASQSDVHFPTVSGQNLDREAFTFPEEFLGDINILLVPFLEPQQQIVNTWIPFSQELEASYEGVAYYEFPTIDSRGPIFRTLLNEGMRAGIPDQLSRERTVTLYLDTTEFMETTGIPSKNEVHILLVNRNGDILWLSVIHI